MNLTQKIISAHLSSGNELPLPGEEIGIKIDQTLTQDATGTLAYLEFEAMGVDRVKTELSVAYIDHNTLGSGYENADDHRYIQTVARKHGIRYSKQGNGICHQVHLERYGKPGKTLIGSDSHTPTAGGLGSLAFGAGGLDVAVAMGGGAYYIKMPKVIGVELVGKLQGWAQAKDVILELLSRLSVKGGVGSVIEYYGEGVKTLSVPERATITNMGAELGATSSIFPSDERTLEFLKQNGREEDYICLLADDNTYDQNIKIDLREIVPLIACPHSPDNVKKVSDIEGLKVDQVCIGSCTNSSLYDLTLVAKILKGKTISPDVSLSISPGSRQVLVKLSESGALADMIAAGARILECACGPCIGMGNSPKYGGVSVRTFNRNFEGRSGTANAQVYLASPAVAAAAAIYGKIVDPKILGDLPEVILPEKFTVNDGMTIIPDFKGEVEKGPNIKSVPIGKPIENNLSEKVILKVGDNITTDHIMPAGAKILPYRSNIPYLSQFCFKVCDEKFAERAKAEGGGIIVGGENYGQGSSREHAALVPLYLGVRAVIAKSFARIHVANLINAGIIPLTFDSFDDYDSIFEGTVIEIRGLKEGIENSEFVYANFGEKKIKLKIDLSERQRKIILKGGLLNYTKENK